ncbi:MAG: TonB-dependent receptor, partial [Candidatus Acidiferrales bacterium]
FGQNQNNYYSNVFTDGTPNPTPPYSLADLTGGLWEEFITDKFKPTSWLTIIGGLRQSNFNSPALGSQAAVEESATDPRVGVAFRIPRINWVFHAFYGDFYQAPPLSTATGQLISVAVGQNAAFAPLHGERDQEHQFGVTIPFRRWSLDADTFQTNASNWLDHNNIGESNLFWPITWQAALIQTWEFTLRSPRLWNRGQFHMAYANQIAQARGPITGGLICGNPPASDCPVLVPDIYQPVDHDQRDTLNVGFDATLPWHAFASTNVYYGSGFTNGTPGAQYPGDYLPAHTSVDLSLGKQFREKYTISITGLNVSNRRVLLDNSLTFGGFHFNDPRQIYVEFRYRFHY